MQDLWRLHYQILLIISQKEFTKTKCKDCDFSFEYESVKDNSIKYKCLSCNKDYSNKINEDLKKRFNDIFKISNQFILMLRKDVYPFE